ncbi:MAG TPA: ABC transporter permease [Fimbriimonadaceae bacterium]|nr:ABC transporter permease [Fimbriimonadaceae bacterium]
MQAEQSVRISKTRAKSARRPLAAATYLLRNSGKTLPLIGVIMLAVMLIAGIVAMIDSITYSIQTIYSYSSNFLAINPRGDPLSTPRFRLEVERNTPVKLERVMVCRGAGTQVNSIVGKWPFVVLGLQQKDFDFWLKRLKVTGIDGRLPRQGRAEAIVSDPVARNLHLKLGSILLKPDSQESYSPSPVKVVGIAHTDQWTMVSDYEFMAQSYFPPIDDLVFFAYNRADQEKLDAWAFKHFKGERVFLWAYREIDRQTHTMFETLFAILNVVIALLVIVITVMMGMLINIYLSQRLVEFGLLQALGYTKRQLFRRVFKESAIVVVTGWVLGVGLGYVLLMVVKRTLMDPNAYAVLLNDPVAFRYTLPVPIAIMLAAWLTVYLRFRNFDPVSVVERRLV